MDKYLKAKTIKNSMKLLKALFLDCPECGKTGYIDKLANNEGGKLIGFFVKCDCSTWFHEFTTKES